MGQGCDGPVRQMNVGDVLCCCRQVRLFMRGAQTVLSDAANPEELFATEVFETRLTDATQLYPFVEALVHTFSTFQIVRHFVTRAWIIGCNISTRHLAIFYIS